MIRITKDNLPILKEWGISSNANKSKKLYMIGFYFILGKSDKVKIRIKPGHYVQNVQGTINEGINSYFAEIYKLKLMNDTAENPIGIYDSKIEIFKIVGIPSKASGKDQLFCSRVNNTDLDNMHAFLSDIYKAQVDKEHTPEKSNVDDFEKLFYMVGNENKYTVDYLVIRTEYVMKPKNSPPITERQKAEINEDEDFKRVLWSLIGPDDSLPVEYYSIANEFKILPYPPDLGKVEMIEI